MTAKHERQHVPQIRLSRLSDLARWVTARLKGEPAPQLDLSVVVKMCDLEVARVLLEYVHAEYRDTYAYQIVLAICEASAAASKFNSQQNYQLFSEVSARCYRRRVCQVLLVAARSR